jgi:hypothetical protein
MGVMWSAWEEFEVSPEEVLHEGDDVVVELGWVQSRERG